MNASEDKSEFKNFLNKYILSEHANGVKKKTAKEWFFIVLDLWLTISALFFMILTQQRTDDWLLNTYYIMYVIFLMSFFTDKDEKTRMSIYSKLFMIISFFLVLLLYVKYYDEIGDYLTNMIR